MTVNLKDSLKENKSVLLGQKASTWEEAIKLGTDLLEATGAITPDYYKNIVKSVKELGPYILLAPGLAMPHARPEDGVVKTAFALVTLQEPVYFEGEEEGADVFLTLAGADDSSHMFALQELMAIVEDEESETGVDIDRIRNCKTVEDVYALIDKYQQ